MADCLLTSLLCAEDNASICCNDDENGLFEFGNYEKFDKNQRFGKKTENLETECSVFDVVLQSDECLGVLIVKECEQFAGFDYLQKLRNGMIDLGARQRAIDWIKKVHAHFNFGPLSAYLSINYLDRFLAAHEFPKDKDWMMQLLAITCLSLALKMEETEVPFLLDLQVCESRFLFEAKTIQKMEILVLTALKWRMQTVTPFSFIDSFIRKLDFDQISWKALILRSTQLILSLINGINFLEFKPSEIAAGVAISVVGPAEISALFQHVQKERILKCMQLVNEMNKGCTKSSKSCTIPQSPICVLEASCLSCNKSDDSGIESTSTKRMRLI